MDKSILVEALSAALGVTVKFQSDCKGLTGVIQLPITGLTTLALLGWEFGNSQLVSYLTSLLKWWSIDDQETTQETPSLRKEIFAIPDDFFDPAFDFDFTDMSESDSDSECARGGEPYQRPYGWMRFALRVRDKYPDGNAWLGTHGWRNCSAPGEWPVSYHGTCKQGAEGIIQTHFKAGPREAYGRGIYSTPDINVANEYASSKKFTSQKNGKTYKVIMQSRINPKKRKITVNKNFWLVPIPEGTSSEKEREIVESSIRPYGLLLKEMEN